jgi:hypothetical protein
MRSRGCTPTLFTELPRARIPGISYPGSCVEGEADVSSETYKRIGGKKLLKAPSKAFKR